MRSHECVILLVWLGFSELESVTSLLLKRMITIICFQICTTKNKAEISEFLRQMPFISHWSKTLLSKVTGLVDKISLIRNQFVIKESEPIKYIYLVKAGEFEIYKNYSKVDEETKRIEFNDNVLKPLLNVSSSINDSKSTHRRNKTSMVSPRMEMYFKKKKTKKTKIGTISNGKIISEHDAKENRDSTISVK